ncbi:MAG: GNAT family N-acetyltransferase [Oscillospiraceae bacterium]|nr:GNAT family N-acetyltransferase [Oscillospiraceae bacterium]
MIRLAVPEERDAITELIRETVKTVYPKYYPPGAADFFIDLHKSEKIAADIEAGKIYVFEADGVIVGTVTINGDDIARLFVKPDSQGKGHGSRLLDFAENIIFGYSGTVRVHSSLPAKSMYIKRGYKEKEYFKILTDNGDYVCCDVMVLEK